MPSPEEIMHQFMHQQQKPNKEEIKRQILKHEINIDYNNNLIATKEDKIARFKIDIRAIELDIKDHVETIEGLEKWLKEIDANEEFEKVETSGREM